jgi:C1A family cysteine protease
MKTIAVIAVIGIAFAAFYSFSSAPNTEVEEAFRSFIEEYRQGYGNSEEYNYRLGVFAENLKNLEVIRAENPEAVFGVNQFSDRTPKEMEAFMGLMIPSEQEYTEVYQYNPLKTVGAFDWASKMFSVKNQGQCGSCWAFSAVAAVEGRYHLTTKGKPKVDVAFSEQQVVDCDKTSQGCNGGWMNNAFNYLRNGFAKQDDYKYTARDGTCQDSSKTKVDKVKGITNIPQGNVAALVSAAQAGPVSVAVDASRWSAYKSGVFSSCGTGLNHGVTLVGADDAGVMKIRNSWGSGWGESGHIRLAKGNTCGVANVASYPTF